MTIYWATFTYEGSPHIAIGDDELSRPVFYRPAGVERYRRKAVRFPSWLKFVDDDEFTDVVEGKGESLEAVLEELQIELDEGNGESA